MATLLQGGGTLRLTTDTYALPTIQNTLVERRSLRMEVSNPVAADGYNVYTRRTSAYGGRLSLNLPHVRRKTYTSNETLILAYRPFNYWNGSAWAETVAWRYDGTRWVGLPWNVYHGDTWRK